MFCTALSLSCPCTLIVIGGILFWCFVMFCRFLLPSEVYSHCDPKYTLIVISVILFWYFALICQFFLPSYCSQWYSLIVISVIQRPTSQRRLWLVVSSGCIVGTSTLVDCVSTQHWLIVYHFNQVLLILTLYCRLFNTSWLCITSTLHWLISTPVFTDSSNLTSRLGRGMDAKLKAESVLFLCKIFDLKNTVFF